MYASLLPAILQFKSAVPVSAIAMQATLAVIVVWSTGLRELLSYLGFTLGLSSAVTVASLFVAVRRRRDEIDDLPGYPWAPLIFIVFTLVFMGLAAIRNPMEMLAAVLTILSAVVLYLLFGRTHVKLTDDACSS